MGATSARGGLEAIRAAERLYHEHQNSVATPPVQPDQLVDHLPTGVDIVMAHGGLWAPRLTAAALRQAGGDTLEAARLIRAHRNTLPRLGTTVATSTDDLELLRRVVPAYREPAGPQLLGITSDYMSRLLNTQVPAPEANPAPRPVADAPFTAPRLLDLLREQNLIVDRRLATGQDPDPVDITRTPVETGAPRSARLSSLARADIGGLVGLWYQSVLGPDKRAHEVYLGEVRHGRLPVRVVHPVTGRACEVGQVRVTEVEAIEDLDRPHEDTSRFDVGYGLCLGHNERKAIAMANLDISIERERSSGGGWLEHLALRTIDGLDSAGLLEHLKLPHYVSFQSRLDLKAAGLAAADHHGEDCDCELHGAHHDHL
ncbi:carbon-phosphorus lyase complex subunit PhnI [Nocardia sp. NPDC004711]